MIGVLKSLLKGNPLTHRIGKAFRNALYPSYRLREMTAAWGKVIEEELDLPKAYAIFRRTRELQTRLAGKRNQPKRYLREAWTKHIGHISLLDIYTKIGLLGWRPPQETILLTPRDGIANPFYLDLFNPYFTIVTEPNELRRLWHESHVREDYPFMMEFRGECMWLPFAWPIIQKAWHDQQRAPLLKLDAEVNERGRRVLASLGMPKDAWFVGLHVREAGFRQQDRQYVARDTVRDADVATYVEAIHAITARGGWVVRCGDASMKPLPELPQTIDYARSAAKADWMDVFLCAGCRFFVGTESGLSHVPATFGVPTLYTNWPTWGITPPCATDYFIPKLCWSEDANRYLNVNEILGSELGICGYTDHFAKRKVKVVDNTADEIEQAVIEMMDELEGPRDKRLGQGVRARFQSHGAVLNGWLMDGFIERHRELFSS